MKKSHIFFLTGILFLFFFQSSAQEVIRGPKTYTHELSEQEKANFHLVGKDFKATDPPPGVVNNIAEFDHMQGVLIRYPFGISYAVIAAFSQEIMVTTIVSSTANQNYVTNQYQSNGVNMSNVNFLIAPTETYWTRDYGPMYVRYGDDQIGVVDFIYNRPDRPNDNLIPQKVAQFLGIQWFGMDLIHTGGNYMTDSYGISSSSELVWDENPTLTHAQINQIMLDYLGINTYHVVPDPNNTYIDHIDCWGKFLDVDKVLIREVPTTHSQYDEIEATAAYYASQISAWGNHYQVYRVWTPNNQPYTNSVILNNRVFVPITGSSWDNAAIASYQQAMPGYTIIGVTGSWQSTDALHCRANGIADINMLDIKHYPLLGDQPYQDEYEISASITAYSGAAIIENEVKVIYQINGGSPQEIIMTYTGGKIYTADITSFTPGAEIAYYITASDQSGRTSKHPFIGAPDPHIFYAGELLFPAIAVSATEIYAWVNEGDIDVEEFLISNSGQAALDFSIEWIEIVSAVTSFSAPAEQWLWVAPVSGTIAPGNVQTIEVTCDGSVMAIGDYEGTIFITSNDPDFPLIEIPVNFHVDFASGIATLQDLNPRITHYPNPFSGQVLIDLELSQSAFVSLEIFGAKGEKIKTLTSKRYDQGIYHFNWDGTNKQGKKANSGTYFYRLKANDFEKVEKLMLMD
jgi:agmatine/peptidylarginine deiminase